MIVPVVIDLKGIKYAIDCHSYIYFYFVYRWLEAKYSHLFSLVGASVSMGKGSEPKKIARYEHFFPTSYALV